MYETYFVRKTADNARARMWARFGCAWCGTHKRARPFLRPGPAQKNVIGSMFGSARESAHRRRQTIFFYRAELNPANSRKPRARMHARPFDLRTPVFPLVRPPACHLASCRVLCRGQSHGRGGSRHRRSHHARDSGATLRSSSRRQCRQCWRHCHHLGGCSLCFVCRSTNLTQAHFPRQVR